MKRLFPHLASMLPIILIASLGSNIAFADVGSLADVLKQIDRATKGVKGLTASASMVDVARGEETRSGDGKVWISMQGKLRLEVKDDNPTTLLCTPQDLFIYDPAAMTAKQYPRSKHLDQLSQYALLGFAPLGKELQKDYLITVLGEETLDDQQVVALELTPTDETLRSVVSKVQLWLDQATWLPVQQRIFHSAAETHLTVRYKQIARDDKIDGSLFKPSWPKGTKKEKI